MARLRDPLKSRSMRLQVSVTPDEVRRLRRLAQRESVPSLSQIAHRLLVEALTQAEREAA